VGRMVWSIAALAATVVALMITAGCDGENPVDTVDGPHLTYTLEECDPTSRVVSKLASFPEDAVTVSGNTVRFQHVLGTYCNAVGDSALTVTTSVQDTDIVVTEWFEGQAVRCTCPFPISGQIDGLAPGAYRIWFIHSVRLDGVSDDDQPEPRLLHQARITISP
jgi:hypothetical protein